MSLGRRRTASGLLVVVAAGLAAAPIAILYGGSAGGLTFLLLAGLGAAALALAHAAAARRDRLGSLSRQFALAVGLAIGQLLVAVVVIAALMFVSGHDAVLIVVITAFAGVVAVRAAGLMAAAVKRDVDELRRGLSAVGEGERSVRMRTEARDELAELAARANAMVGQLAAEESARDGIEAARRGLQAAVSHDLRTPLTSLRLLVEAVGDDIVDDATRRRYMDTMVTHIHALGALIDDLFELSRLEAGEIDWSMEQVRLDELVAETVEAMRVSGEARGVTVRAEVPEGLAAARASPEKLQRVLFNLIQNAIRHTPADGSVTVRARAAPEAVEVEVADTGAGIPAEEAGRVFEPFFRGGTQGASRTQDGAGLGLAISRAIVEAHGGRIWLDAAEAGTRVRFSLPRA